MQLFTLGLTQLNLDGSPVLDQNNNPVPTYDQTVVTNLAKAFTGWTYPTAPGATPKINNPEYYIGQMFAVESEHDTTAKTIFANITIPAGQTAEQDLDSVLDALMAQPDHGAIRQPAIDPASGHQQSEPAIYRARFQRLPE